MQKKKIRTKECKYNAFYMLTQLETLTADIKKIKKSLLLDITLVLNVLYK